MPSSNTTSAMTPRPMPNAFSPRHLLIGLAMVCTAILAVVMKPSQKLADQTAQIDFETMIPRQFDSWRVDDSVTPVIANPQQQAVIGKIYAQTLSRTYVNGRGERVMLTIAYGTSQSDDLQVHRPEVCYSAQGFQVGEPVRGRLSVAAKEIPVTRLVAVNGLRNEPITYWTTVGDKVVKDNWDSKKQQLKLGFRGVVPDGLLFRVSTISADEASSFKLQNEFINTLLGALKPGDRQRLTGSVN
ncbi:MAG: exosortase-associated protein EpsI, B-type [Candidatus Methylumidiphilus sp.]